MKIKRTTVTLPNGLYRRAEVAIQKEAFASFSAYVQHLIRQDVQQRGIVSSGAVEEIEGEIVHTVAEALHLSPSSDVIETPASPKAPPPAAARHKKADKRPETDEETGLS